MNRMRKDSERSAVIRLTRFEAFTEAVEVASRAPSVHQAVSDIEELRRAAIKPLTTKPTCDCDTPDTYYGPHRDDCARNARPSEDFLSGYNAGRHGEEPYDVSQAWVTYLRHGGQRRDTSVRRTGSKYPSDEEQIEYWKARAISAEKVIDDADKIEWSVSKDILGKRAVMIRVNGELLHMCSHEPEPSERLPTNLPDYVQDIVQKFGGGHVRVELERQLSNPRPHLVTTLVTVPDGGTSSKRSSKRRARVK